MPSIAVIIPVYNHAKYIASTLDSVLAQTRPADHIIVIDDGSKDDSVEIARSYGSKGVDFEAQENAGAHNTLNRLVKKAHAAGAEFVAILNSDDRYLPGRLEACLKAFENDPEKAVVCSELKVIDDEGAPLADDHPRTRWFRAAWSAGKRDGVSIPEWLGRANFIATTSNVVARTEYLLANPFRDYRFAHDYYFLSAAAVRDQIAMVREPHLEYRVHGSNTITTAPAPLIKEMVRIHLDLYAGLAEELQSDHEKRSRFTQYGRALWENISAFDAGLFQSAVADLLSKTSDEERKAAAEALAGDALDTFPNRQLVNTFDGTPLGDPTSGISDRLDSALRERSEAKSALKTNANLARIRAKIAASRWLALGRVLGISGKLTRNEGKSADEKLEKLEQVPSSCYPLAACSRRA